MSGRRSCGRVSKRGNETAPSFMRGCLSSIVLVCSALASVAAADKPNILLVISEDNGPQFGCYGDRTVPTPHVDRLAATGVRFTNAYVTQAVCSPSRASI